MMTNGECPGGADNSEQPCLFQINAAVFGLELTEEPETCIDIARIFGEQFRKTIVVTGDVECFLPNVQGQSSVAMHSTHVEKNIDRQQLFAPCNCYPTLDALTPR